MGDAMSVTTLAGAEDRMLVDGQLVAAVTGGSYPNVNPATEEVIGHAADASAADVDLAVGAARRAFDETSWATDHAFRARCIRQLAEALSTHRERFREVVVAEAGCPVLLTHIVQVDQPVADLPWWADLADSYDWEQPLPDHEFYGSKHRRLVLKEPVGVVAAITAWNFPLYLNLAKLGPALAAGNAVVLKPAPDTPFSGLLLGRIIAEHTDIPPGIVNVVTAADPAAGELLTTDPRVDMITFTGSSAVGKKIMVAASDTVKRVTLELGGKSAHIVLDDADLASIVPLMAMGMCTHAGQGCAITTRLLVPRSRYDEAVELAAEAMAGVPFGDPTDPSNLMGPVVNARQRDRILGLVDQAVAEGARVVTGGGRPSHLDRGFFVEPTLLADVQPGDTIAQEEVFGPVLSVLAFDDDDDAVRIANDSRYGLSGAVSSASEERSMAVARRLRTGTVGINGGQWFAVDSPFGGYRQSGLGRECGVQGFEEYLETKTLGLPGG